MDLLGDIGASDQLTSTRAENKVLKEKVERLEGRLRVLAVENEALKAEVEMYRTEFAGKDLAGSSSGTKGVASSADAVDDTNDHFITSGNGTYPKNMEAQLSNLHDNANPSCCSLNNDDTILATGGADRNLSLLQWGAALSTDDTDNADDVVKKAIRVFCGAPVIAVDFSRKPRSPFVAAGCMDGTCHVVHYATTYNGIEATQIGTPIKHAKYVKGVAWSSDDNLLATASADGSVQIHKIVWNGLDEIEKIQLEKVKALNLPGPVEALCFHNGHLICYARGTPYLSYFDVVSKDYELVNKINLNQGPGNAGFDDHVSFSVMHIKPFGDYLALATDSSRNIILEFATGKQVRNLYGHKNDGYSQPKIGWSQNGQYLFGNTQDDATICVWDIASAEIVQRLEEGHGQPIRDLCSSLNSDTMVSTSFDKKTLVWLA